jgi:hypothetical protein
MKTLEKGDVVQLRSGGPLMTVFSITEAKEASPGLPLSPAVGDIPPTLASPEIIGCVWFTKEHEVRNGNYDRALLTDPVPRSDWRGAPVQMLTPEELDLADAGFCTNLGHICGHLKASPCNGIPRRKDHA